MLQYFVIMFAAGVALVSGHGRMIQPPSRASMFRFGYNNPPDYNDNELNCGGFGLQQQLGGKCGICGNPYNGPRHHEAGGRYANGIITGSYVMGQVIRVLIEITANHRGYFMFKVCPNNNVSRVITQECLDEYALELADGSGTKYHIDNRLGIFDIDLKLPKGLICSQCVLQWMYRCGNNNGVGENGVSCLGCGPQEEFYACSDIEILSNSGHPVSQPLEVASQTTPVVVSQTTPVVVSQTTPFAASQTLAKVSRTTPDDDLTQGTVTESPATVSRTTTDDATVGSSPMNSNCIALDHYRTIQPQADLLCKHNCLKGLCPATLCKCPNDTPPTQNCVANGSYKGDANMDIWCRINCRLGFCPISHCICIRP